VHTEPVQVVLVPGDHGSVLAAPNVQTLTEALAEAIGGSEGAATDAAPDGALRI